MDLYTPITGSLLLLKQIVPYILIAGIVYIPFSIVSLLIPHPPPASKNPICTQSVPINIHNWLLIHLITAAHTCKFTLAVNPVIPISSILGMDGMDVHWDKRRGKAELAMFISRMKVVTQNHH